jgi:hypothetical protein
MILAMASLRNQELGAEIENVLSILTERHLKGHAQSLSTVYMCKCRRIGNDSVGNECLACTFVFVDTSTPAAIQHLSEAGEVNEACKLISNLFDHLFLAADIAIRQRLYARYEARICLILAREKVHGSSILLTM